MSLFKVCVKLNDYHKPIEIVTFANAYVFLPDWRVLLKAPRIMCGWR